MADVRLDDLSENKDVPAKKKGSRFARFLRKLVLFGILAFALYIGVCYLLASVFIYSEGDRTGYVNKFSHKGYVFKTYEGILKTGFVNFANSSTPNEEWAFSVADKSVADSITGIDQRVAVKLYYKEYYTRLFFKGDTKYFVYKIEKLPSP